MHLSTALSASLERTQLHADLLDGPAPWQSLPGPELTAIAELVTRVLGSNMSAFSVLDRDWQWLTARCGIDEAKLPREHSFCGRVVDTNEAVIIPDSPPRSTASISATPGASSSRYDDRSHGHHRDGTASVERVGAPRVQRSRKRRTATKQSTLNERRFA